MFQRPDLVNNHVLFTDNDSNSSDSCPRTFFTEHSSKVYEHYLDYHLEDSGTARQLCFLLRTMEKDDKMFLRINSLGGRFDIAAQIVNAIKDCKGVVTGVIEQECASAASMIFLSCDQWQVYRWGEMMIHYASYSVGGKSHEITAKVRSHDSLFPKIFSDIYRNFLTEDEIDNIIRGQDMYLTSDAIETRLKNVVKHLTEERDNEGREELEETSEQVQVSSDSSEYPVN